MKLRNRFLILATLMLISTSILSACSGGAPATAPATSSTSPTSSPTSSAPPSTTKPPATTTAPTTASTGSGKPQYGGQIIRLTGVTGADPTSWGPFPGAGATPQQLQELWAGDWSLGPAGGYGQKLTDWAQTVDRNDRKVGLIAEKTTWSVNGDTGKATIVYTIRQGIHYQKVPNSAAAALVNGRELTADDVVFCLQQRITDPGSYVYLSNPELRNAVITKTGPQQVTVVVDAPYLLTALNRFSSTTGFYPPEVFQKFNKMADWKDQVGTGAFMLTGYVSGSTITYTRNPDYWEKDPGGPGKGNQLPYADSMVTLMLTDVSTRIAALRTGKIDTLSGVLAQDAGPLISGSTAVKDLKVLEKTSVDGRGTPVFFNLEVPPFQDIRVRQALFMGTDFNSLLQSLYNGKGQIMTYPFADTTDYHDLYLGLNDTDTPQAVKDLFTYNPTEAKQLLSDAGYRTGLSTSILLTSADQIAVDYYTAVAQMWSKIGVTLKLDIKDNGAYVAIQGSHTGYQMTTQTTAPAATFYLGVAYQGRGSISNLGNLNDPVVNSALHDINNVSVVDITTGMKLWREDISKYVLTQAYAMPNVIGYNYNIWWPWLANYSGEGPVSYAQTIWPNYVWVDQSLKKSMGK